LLARAALQKYTENPYAEMSIMLADGGKAVLGNMLASKHQSCNLSEIADT
jgi:hypothetical protein